MGFILFNFWFYEVFYY